MPTTARPPCSGWGSCPYDRHAVKRLGPAFAIVMLLEMQIPCRGNIAVVASADIAEIVDLVEFLIELEGACIQTGHVAVVFFHPGDVKDDDPRHRRGLWSPCHLLPSKFRPLPAHYCKRRTPEKGTGEEVLWLRVPEH